MNDPVCCNKTKKKTFDKDGYYCEECGKWEPRDAWVSVDFALPPWNDKYLATDGEEIQIMVYFGKDRHGEQGEWSSYECNTLDVTHWMALPELPK